MTQITTFVSGIVSIITESMSFIGANDNVMLAPFVFFLIINVVQLFRLILLASYRRGF